MNGLLVALIAAVFLVGSCAALEERAPALDGALTKAARVGGCVKAVCSLPLRSLDDCGPAVGSCR